MAQITGIKKITNGTLGSSSDMNDNYSLIKTTYNAHDSATTGVHNIGSKTIASSTYLQTLIDLYNPVGSVLDMWRPSDITFEDSIDADIYELMDGSTISDSDSKFNTVTLPDMTNRYFIGCGSEEGGDNLSATGCNATAIGASEHIINATHISTFQDHDHTHTHPSSTHNHKGDTTASSGIYFTGGTGYSRLGGFFDQSFPTPISHDYTHSLTFSSSTSSSSSITDYCSPVIVFSGDFNNSESVVSKSGTTSANSSSSTTEEDFDIQPSSLAVRRYIRYK